MIGLDPAVGAVLASLIAAAAGIVTAVIATKAKRSNTAEHGQVIERLDKLNDKFDRHIEWHLQAMEWERDE